MDPAGTAGERINDRTAQNATFPGDVNSEARHAPAGPSRARRPVTRPLDRTRGSARRSAISPSWLCRSISAMPAVTPKLPSICIGGFAIPHSRKQGRSPGE